MGILLLLLTLPSMVSAQFIYTTNNDTITIARYIGPGGAIDIPDALAGLPVTSIGDRAFYNYPYLTSVTIPSSVTSVGDYTFYGCKALTNMMIANSVTNIGDQAFAECSGLVSVTMPNSIPNIGDGTFADCYALNSVTIPNSVTRIGINAFYGCQALTNIMVPSGVTNIGYGAFQWCSSLASITVSPENPSYSSVDGVLFNKDQTRLIQCPGGKSGSYTIPDSVTTIGDSAFALCRSLSNVTIPNSVTSLGTNTFYSCLLTSVKIPSSVTSIGDYAFYLCTSLASVSIPASVTSIGDSAFAGTWLTSVTIPGSVTNIGSYAFDRILGLSGVFFQGNAPTAGLNAFMHPTIYYLPGATGWGKPFCGLTPALWNAQVKPSDSSFGVRTNQFGFKVILQSATMPVVVEVCSDLANPTWTPLKTNRYNGSTSWYFSDPQWTNYPTRLYRLHWP